MTPKNPRAFMMLIASLLIVGGVFAIYPPLALVAAGLIIVLDIRGG